ncbi:MAG TPA: OmpA family protein [Gemmatimonadales bacterium]|nr:OmpA family protein [Gemmatimonadales bacterium]
MAALMPLALSCAMNKAEKGAIIGAGAGGAAGAVIGKATGSTVRGAIIGAVVGGATGAIIGHQMDKQAEELAYDLPGAVVQRIGEGITVTFPEGLLFGFDSDQINSVAGDNLRRFAASLQKYSNTRTLIVGHTDSDGSADYNMDLSNRRALSAANFITGEGVDRARISTAGRGEAEPIATNGSDAGRQLNRRVEVAIYADAAARGGQ